MSNNNDILERLTTEAYEYGFVTDIEMDIAPKGLNEETVRFISAKKNEPGMATGMAVERIAPFSAIRNAALAEF